MNEYDHEDAFIDANSYAGRNVKLSEALKVAANKDTAKKMIEDCQDMYLALFTAFIAGVDWVREKEKYAKGKDIDK